MTTVLSIAPILVLVIGLAALRLDAWKAALAALLVCVVEALLWKELSIGNIAIAAAKGVSTGLYPIGLVIIAALYTYAVAVESGAMEEIKRGLRSLSSDECFLALLVAWGFGNFMEGMSGFGTAVAIPCAILVAIGFDPVKAVLCCLVANTTPTAFGSVGVPTVVLSSETDLDIATLSKKIVFLQLAVTSLSPFLILYITNGVKALREHWRLAILADVAFLVPWVAVASTLGCELPDIIGGLAVMVSFAFIGNRKAIDARGQLRAWIPFIFVVGALGVMAMLPASMKVSPGLVILFAASIGGLCQRIAPSRLAALVFVTLRKYSLALFTICSILALAKIMGAAGMTQSIAEALVGATGRGYSAVSAIVGAFAGFVTGSGTSSNVLFGALQASVGTNDVEKVLFAAANIMGAGIGKMICPQSIVLGCAAANLAGQESKIMSKAFAFFAGVLICAAVSVVIFYLA